MARVDFPADQTPFFNPALYANTQGETKKAKDRAPVRGGQKVRFSTMMDDAASAAAEASAVRSYPVSEETVKALLDDVHDSGDKLRNRPFPEEIKQYKQSVHNFLRYIVDNGYAIEEHTSGANLLKRKKFTIVQVVDHKLEQLAAGILSGQTAQIELLARIDEIQGLLIDLLQ
ncbi:hypothetical protein FACS1894141_4280 [Spirochaetia bacterium]|nr:hypothetical protein FACS1894141_4280 [Spirochaetia bacterium]